MHRSRFALLAVAALGCAMAACSESDGDDDGAAAGGAAAPSAGAGGSAGGTTTGGATGSSTAGASASAGRGNSAGTGMGPAGRGGSGASGGASGASGAGGSAGASGAGGAQGASGEGSAGSGGAPGELEPFSFFVTSWAGLQRLADRQTGFGGDLRYGEQDGLSGADKICSELAESSMPGSAAKQWRAFLSVGEGPSGQPVHAIDRIGEGPWYDRRGRIVAMTKAALLNTRPMGAHQQIINDLPNETGTPNHQPDPTEDPVDNHHVLTGSDAQGRFYGGNSDCDNWTSTAASAGRPRVGFSWPAGGRQHWISGQDEGGCGAGAVLVDRGGSDPSNPIVGSGGGYGAFYCFALSP